MAYLVTYLALLAAHVALVWLLPYFPTQDGPSHLYNLVILRDLVGGVPVWDGFFTVRSLLAPNLGFNALAFPLLYLFEPYTVERIFVTIYVLLMGTSVPFLVRSFDRPALPVSFFVFPLIFNYSLAMGFYSYILAVPLLLTAFGVSWRLRDRPWWARFAFYNAAGLIIFLCHVVAALFFVIVVATLATARQDRGRGVLREVGELGLLLAPLLVGFAAYVLSSPPTALGGIALFSPARTVDLLAMLVTFSSLSYSRWQLVATSSIMLLYLALGYVSMKAALGRYRQLHAVTDRERVLLRTVSSMVVFYFVAPFQFGGGGCFNERFPWVVLLLTLPLLELPPAARWRRSLSLALVGAATWTLAVTSWFMWQQSNIIEEYVGGLPAPIPTSSLIAAYRTLPGGHWPEADALAHAVSHYALATRSVDVGNYEVDNDFFPVKKIAAAPEVPSVNQILFSPSTIDWAAYPAIDFVIGWQVDSTGRDRLQAAFDLIVERNRLTIWRHRASPTTSRSPDSPAPAAEQPADP